MKDSSLEKNHLRFPETHELAVAAAEKLYASLMAVPDRVLDVALARAHAVHSKSLKAAMREANKRYQETMRAIRQASKLDKKGKAEREETDGTNALSREAAGGNTSLLQHTQPHQGPEKGGAQGG